jgi:hypothetical protein
MHWYQRNISDYYYATRFMTHDEERCYLRLIDHYHDTEKPITLDIAAVARKIGIEDQGLIARVLGDKFEKRNDGWHDDKVDAAIAAYHSMKQGGRRGAARRWGRPDGGLPIPTPSPPHAKASGNHEPRTDIHEPRTSTPSSSLAKSLEEGLSFLTPEKKKERSADLVKLAKKFDRQHG